MENIGIVIIGRNEGNRLKNCINSVINIHNKIVYVDSGSSDGSIEFCQSTGVDSFPLDPNLPFSAARARNEGFSYLTTKYPAIEYVQFIDGDCELMGNWLREAVAFLCDNNTHAIVCGKVTERFPDKTIYNRLCEIEWSTDFGDVDACGGIFIVRVSIFKQIKGFDINVIAGEEPELCYRLRKSGWKINKINTPMVTHDADIKYFSQWWVRMTRSGYGYAYGYHLHHIDKNGFCKRESLRIWFWSFILPVFITILSSFNRNLLYAIPLCYTFLLLRIATRFFNKTRNIKNSFLYALFITIGKFPEFTGQLKFLFHKFIKSRNEIIEYK